MKYYPPEVSSMKYCCLGVFSKEYFRLVTNYIVQIGEKSWYSWVVKIRNASELVLRPQYPLAIILTTVLRALVSITA